MVIMLSQGRDMSSDERAAERPLPVDEADPLCLAVSGRSRWSVAVGQAIESGMKAFYRRRRRGLKGNGARLDTRGRVWFGELTWYAPVFSSGYNMTSPGRLSPSGAV